MEISPVWYCASSSWYCACRADCREVDLIGPVGSDQLPEIFNISYDPTVSTVTLPY